jgi:hypothetical protein
MQIETDDGGMGNELEMEKHQRVEDKKSAKSLQFIWH